MERIESIFSLWSSIFLIQKLVFIWFNTLFWFLFAEHKQNQNRVRYSYKSHYVQWEAGRSENTGILLHRYQSRHFSKVLITTDRWRYKEQSGNGYKESVYREDKALARMDIWQNSFITIYTHYFCIPCWLSDHWWFYGGV